MDNSLSEHDPYRGMRRAQDDIQPDFAPGDVIQKGANKLKDNTKKSLKAAEDFATKKGVGKQNPSVNAAKKTEKTPNGLFSGTGRDLPKGTNGKRKFSFGKKSARIFVGAFVGMTAVWVFVIGAPIYMIGALDYNLQNSIGISFIQEALEGQARHVTVSMLLDGKVPDKYANDLAKVGINVGQVTANGEFIRTNSFIANIDDKKDLASLGSGFHVRTEDGELAVLFEDEVIKAEDFATAVEANPAMFMAYSEATDIMARFFYSREVNDIFSEMCLTRHSFHDFESTGDAKKDQDNFNKILEEMLNCSSDVNMSGAGADGSEFFSASMEGNAEEIISEVGEAQSMVSTANATSKAAQLLNSAISANEPYKAAASFMAIEEPIQRARIEGDGPVNELMNVLQERSVATYVDVNTGKTVSNEHSILDTPNFSAAVSQGKFSKEEAANFARDRVLKSTDSVDGDVIKDTAVSQEGQKKVDTVLGISLGNSADEEVLKKASDNIEIAALEKNSDLFKSEIGGNRAVEGGSFISKTISMSTLGAMPSDEEAVLVYNHEVNEALAKRAAAERATKSPFDISSPNTFLGSIMHSFAVGMLKNSQVSNGVSFVSSVGSLANVTNDSFNGLFGGAIADGEDSNYWTTFGNLCETPKGVKSSADIYCTQTTTITTKFMDKKLDVDKEEYEKFVKYGMGRKPTVGVNDAKACEDLADKTVIDEIADIFGVYAACDAVRNSDDKAIVSGAAYVISVYNENRAELEKMSGYALRDKVESLLTESESTAERIKREYLAEHPVDHSAAGIIAERSGLSKEEAQIALNYYNYLARISNYDPTTRFAFGETLVLKHKSPLKDHSNSIALNYYAVKRGEIEYNSIRNRSFAA